LESAGAKEVGEHAVVGMAVAVVYNDKVILAEDMVLAKLVERRRLITDTVFQLASVSKPIGATVGRSSCW